MIGGLLKDTETNKQKNLQEIFIFYKSAKETRVEMLILKAAMHIFCTDFCLDF